MLNPPGELRLPAPLRALAALGCGAVAGLGYAPANVGPLFVVGLAGLTLLLAGRGARATLGLGYLFGLGLGAVAINWLYGLGWWIAVALVVVYALFYAGYAACARLALRLPLWPVLAAAAWTLTEFVQCRFPFGGFGWIRAGYVAVDSPLAGLLALVGVTGVGFLVTLLAQLLAGAVDGVVHGPRQLGRLAVLMLATGLALGSGAIALAFPPPAPPATARVSVGLVQGNVNGVDPLEPFGRARTVTQNHLAETVTLMAKARAGLVPEPDFVLWPENSTDVDPILDAQTRDIIQTAARVTARPILVGAVLEGPADDERQTAALWWTPDGRITARYFKRNLVPFGEFIPYRDFFLPKFPILERTGAQSVPGTAPGALQVGLPDGRQVTIGDVICFELAWDSTVYDTVDHGAQVIMVQSNNASYNGTSQPSQQWQMTRARAMETGRDIVVATTDSVSGVIHPDGSVTYRTREYTADSTVQTVALRSDLTPAMEVAPTLEIVLASLGGVGALVGGASAVIERLGRRRGRRYAPAD